MTSVKLNSNPGEFCCVVILLVNVNGEESPRGNQTRSNPFRSGFRIDRRVRMGFYLECNGTGCVLQNFLLSMERMSGYYPLKAVASFNRKFICVQRRINSLYN